MTPTAITHSAIILAGGRGSRLGGVAKPLIEVGGRTMLAAALEAAAGADEVVVVGEVPVPDGVRQVVEDPPFGGPAAGVAAGLAALDSQAAWVLLLASDVPGVDAVVPELVAAAGNLDRDLDGVCYEDEAGHPQWILGLYRSAPLRAAAAAAETTNLSLRRLLAPLRLHTIQGDSALIADCDTWDDIKSARAKD